MAKPMAVRRVPYSSLRYNTKAARYIGTHGRFLSPRTVDQIIIGDLDAVRLRMQNAGQQLASQAAAYVQGAIDKQTYLESVIAWRNQMALQIKAMHMGNVAAGKGGFHNLTQSDFGRAGHLIKTQYKYLSDFAVEAAKDPLLVLSQSPGRMDFMTRNGLYADAGRATFFVFQHIAHVQAGFRKIKNEFDPGSKHCDHDETGCIQIDALGVVDIDDPRFLLPGQRFCQNKDRCGVTYLMA